MSPSNELLYVSMQLTALAEATPVEKFSWRPEPGVRSTSEIYMHIVAANFGLLNVIDLCYHSYLDVGATVRWIRN